MNTRTIKTSALLYFFSLLTLVMLAPVGQADEMLARASDKEVKALVKEIAKDESRFEKALDSKFKRSILRGPSTEVDVGTYLKDLSASITNLEKRFTGSYAASAEATDVFTRSSTMHSYVRQNPSMKGANEWDAVAAKLQRLAMAYGVSFPLESDDVVRRIGDGELADAADELRKFAGSFDKVLSQASRGNKELSEPVKAGKGDLKFISSTSKTLASRIRRGNPASAEARQVIDAVGRVEALVNMAGMPESVATEWNEGTRSINKISQAFGL